MRMQVVKDNGKRNVKIYSENGVQEFDSYEEALKAGGFIQYDINNEKYVSGNGETLTEKEYKESKITDAERISDAVNEKMEKVAEIYKNLNRIFNFEKREEENNIPFYSREGEILSLLKEKPGYYYEGKQRYFDKEIIEKFNDERKARKEAVNNTMNNVNINMSEIYVLGLDTQAYMNEGRKAFLIKRAYDEVMESGREVDRAEAQKMMGIYLAAYNDEKVLEPVQVEIRQTPENEYYKEALNGKFNPKEKVLITVPMEWVTERSKRGTEDKFDVIKFPQDFKVEAAKGKYEFYFNIKEGDGVKKENKMCSYPFAYNDVLRLKKCIGKDPLTNQWRYDVQFIAVKELNKAVKEFLNGKEQEKNQEVRMEVPEQEDEELMESYGFSLR